MTDEKKKKSPFTVDELSNSNLHVMPSVNRLLNRKGFAIPTSPPDRPGRLASPPIPKKVERQITHEEDLATRTDIIFAPPEMIENLPPLAIQTRHAKLRAPAGSELHIWEYGMLQTNPDPLAKGIISLMGNGGLSALFMALIPPPPGSAFPHFLGSALAGELSKQTLWTGLKWDPLIVPSVWNYFVRSGSAELAPPGTLTDQTSQRNVLRGAFGLLPDEWLLLVRVGPESACRGVLALVSKKSLLSALSEAMSFLAQPAPPSA